MTLDANSSQDEKNAHYRGMMREYVARVSAGDPARICELFADDAAVEDPVGGPWGVLQGKEAIRGFFDAVAAAGVKLELTGHICGTKGNKAAFPMIVTVKHVKMNCVSVATFNEAGKIVRYDAHWGPGDYTPADRDPAELVG